MENGDLALWEDKRVVIVLEGVLAQIPPPETHTEGLIRRTKHVEWADPNSWGWSRTAIKQINDRASRYSQAIDIVTFLDPEVGDMAADWLFKYDVQIASCEYVDFDVFCDSLSWRPSVHTVVDSVPSRLDRYGVRAYEVQWGGFFF